MPPLPFLSRRGFLVNAAGTVTVVSLGGLASACKTVGGGTLKADTYGTMPTAGGAYDSWLEGVSPLARVLARQVAFTGDEPQKAHEVIRDQVVGSAPASTLAPEEADIVVIGGGISGLAAAYRIVAEQAQAHPNAARPKIIILEQAPRFGGNAKGEIWGNINYSIGAAYMIKAVPGEELYDKFYGPLQLDKLWRESGEDVVELGGKLFRDFWDGETLDESDVVGRRLFQLAKKELTQLANLKDGEKDPYGLSFPEIPVKAGDFAAWAEIGQLDRKSLLEIMTERYPYADTGKLHPHMATLIEQYCWSSFAGSATEISAAAGLNFLAGEFIGIAGLPGGNSQVGHQLLRSLVYTYNIETSALRTNALVTRVANAGSGVVVEWQSTQGNGATQTIKARMAVVACPKFVAKHIVEGMTQDQKNLINTRMSWRSYLVANALYEHPMPSTTEVPSLDLYLLGKGETVVEKADQVENAAAKVGATDLLQGHWAQQNRDYRDPLGLDETDRWRSVLSMYRAMPFDGARTSLILYPAKNATADAYKAKEAELLANFRGEFEAQANAIVPKTLGLSAKPVEVRVTRWGHPLSLASKGLFRPEVALLFQEPLKNIYFCNQDNWSLPAIETCLGEALTVSSKICARLNGAI